jgi:hypothetical protein
MTAKKKSLLNKAHILGPVGSTPAGLSRTLARPDPVPAAPGGERLRPSQRRPQSRA